MRTEEGKKDGNVMPGEMKAKGGGRGHGKGKEHIKRKEREHEEYSHLLETVKPKGARYLTEKYRYWLDNRSPIVRQNISDELGRDKERILYVRIFSSMFWDYHVMERTGYTFKALYPGIELCDDLCSSKPFDMLLRGNDGTSLFILYVGARNLSPKQLTELITSRTDFLREHLEDLKNVYDLKGSIHLGLLLTEREKPALKKGLQLFGNTEGSREFGEVHVIEVSLENKTIHGFPSMHGDEGRGLVIPESVLLNTPPLDLRAIDYLLFEMVALQGCYAEHLMEDHIRPKEMTNKELESSLLRGLGLERRPNTRPPLNFDVRKAFAMKRLEAVLETALGFNLIEDGSAAGSEDHGITGKKGEYGAGNEKPGGNGIKEGRRKVKPRGGPYRLICQGTDLTMVRRNLLKKYLDGMAVEGAAPLAEKKAVEAYRRRYPRIDMTF